MKGYQKIFLAVTFLFSKSFAAYPALNRADVIIKQKLSETEATFQKITIQLRTLDKNLEVMEHTLTTTQSELNHAAIASTTLAAISLGLTALALKPIRYIPEGGILTNMAYTLGATLATALSAGSGAYFWYTNKTLNLTEIEKNIHDLRFKISQIQSSSEISLLNRAHIQQLDSKLRDSQELIKHLHSEQTIQKRNQLLVTLSQASGLFFMFYSFYSTSPVLNIGPILMIAGNIGQIAITFSKDQRDILIRDIQKLRKTIQDAILSY